LADVEFVFVLDEIARLTSTTWHIFFFYFFPVDFFPAQVFQQQNWAFTFPLRKEFTVEWPVNQQMSPMRDTRNCHIAPKRVGPPSNAQINDLSTSFHI
jgi:hypothetical protein